MMHFDRPRRSRDADHGVVYRNENEFAAWPFYNGLWRVSDGDLVFGFKIVPCIYSEAGEVHHDHLSVGKGHIVTMRSHDDGASWDSSTLQQVMDLSLSADDVVAGGRQDYRDEAPLDFTDPDVLVMSGALPALFTPQSRTWLRVSSDGGRSWRRPIILPMSGLPSLTGHGSETTRPDGVNLLCLMTVTRDGWTRRPLVYASPDGHQWHFLSFMTPITDDGASVSDKQGSPRFGAHRYVYPRPLQLSDGRVIASIRCQRDPTGILWTEILESEDGGRTWRFLSRVNDFGAPGDIKELSDGRIICVYGYRKAPFGVRYRVSEDGGRTWGTEIVLRDDGASWDVGYPRVIEIAPGKCLAGYYINLKSDTTKAGGGVRHVARTIFTPE